jgi:Leucine-rich repeat (LRR) protein
MFNLFLYEQNLQNTLIDGFQLIIFLGENHQVVTLLEISKNSFFFKKNSPNFALVVGANGITSLHTSNKINGHLQKCCHLRKNLFGSI